jgi:hypothetical protein
MSSPRFTIKKVSVEEQHEEYINEIKKLKSENETLKKIITNLTFQTAGITSSFLHSPKISEYWEQVDP